MGHGLRHQLGGRHAIGLQHQALQQAPAPHPGQLLGMAVYQLAQQAREQLAHAPGVGHQLAPLQLGHHGEAGAAGKGIAPEGAGVFPGPQHIGPAVHRQGPNWNAAAQALGQGEGIGLHAQVLVAPEAAAAADPHLHLIEDQQDVAFIAELADPGKKGRIARIDAPFPLQGFQQHGRHPGTIGLALLEQGFKGGRVVVGEEAKPLHHGLEPLVILGLARGADGRQGAAVEAGLGREDHRPLDAAAGVAVFAGQLDRRLVGLSPRIAEKHPIGAAVAGDPARQLLLLRDPVKVRDMLQPSQLAAQRLPHGRVAVAEGAGGDTRHAVEVPAALVVPQPAAPALFEGQGIAAVGVHHGMDRL